jgi:hypothetical protein
MLARGDVVEDIAVWFGLNVQAVEAVQASAVHPFLTAAPAYALPPAGPYEKATVVYRALDAVREAERRLAHLSCGVRNAYADPLLR